SGGHSGTVSFDSAQALTGPGLQFDNADGTYTTAGVTGSLSVGSGATAGIPFALSNSDATVTYSGSISKSSAGAAISIDNHDSGTITFDTGPLSSTGSSSGIVVQNSNGGT